MFWLLITLLLEIFGAVLYLLVRGDEVVKSGNKLRDERRKFDEKT